MSECAGISRPGYRSRLSIGDTQTTHVRGQSEWKILIQVNPFDIWNIFKTVLLIENSCLLSCWRMWVCVIADGGGAPPPSVSIQCSVFSRPETLEQTPPVSVITSSSSSPSVLSVTVVSAIDTVTQASVRINNINCSVVLTKIENQKNLDNTGNVCNNVVVKLKSSQPTPVRSWLLTVSEMWKSRVYSTAVISSDCQTEIRLRVIFALTRSQCLRDKKIFEREVRVLLLLEKIGCQLSTQICCVCVTYCHTSDRESWVCSVSGDTIVIVI